MMLPLNGVSKTVAEGESTGLRRPRVCRRGNQRTGAHRAAGGASRKRPGAAVDAPKPEGSADAAMIGTSTLLNSCPLHTSARPARRRCARRAIRRRTASGRFRRASTLKRPWTTPSTRFCTNPRHCCQACFGCMTSLLSRSRSRAACDPGRQTRTAAWAANLDPRVACEARGAAQPPGRRRRSDVVPPSQVSRHRPPLSHFVVRVCAVVGGVFTLVGGLDQVFQHVVFGK
jgi:hypothetical protein